MELKNWNYRKFGEKVYKIRDVITNIKLKKQNKKIIDLVLAKATTALNFYGIKNEWKHCKDNKLKHNKFVPDVRIPIKTK